MRHANLQPSNPVSRGFVKEDPWEEPVIPPRAPLPEGVPNYVTPRGLELLREEEAALDAERLSLPTERDDEVVRRQRLIVTRRLKDLAGRIAIAEVIDPADQTHDTIRFGARITIQSSTEGTSVLQIVGVDEADPDHGLVGFTAPIARALLGKAVGETTELSAGGGTRSLRVLAIEYGPSRP